MCLIKWVYIMINYNENENKMRNRSHRDHIKRARSRCEHGCTKHNIIYHGVYVYATPKQYLKLNS